MSKKRRYDIRGILANPDLRRKLMVPTIQSTQAREGIETTREQAEHAYIVVTEQERATFFDLERFRGGKDEPDSRHEMFVRALDEGIDRVRFDIARRDFEAIEGSPLAYSRVGLVAHVFREAPALDPAWGIAAQGLATAADERFVRYWWELPTGSIGEGKDWVPFAKGGQFSRFYADVHLVVYWRDNGAAIRFFEGAYIRNEQHYFKAGLTWPLAASVFNVRWLPSGCVFGHKGPAIFPTNDTNTSYLAGILNARFAEYLLLGLTSRQAMGGRWEVGVIKRFPIPDPTTEQHKSIAIIAETIYGAKSTWDKGNETATHFCVPWIIREDIVDLSMNLATRLDRLQQYEASEESCIQGLYDDLNDAVYTLYGTPDRTRRIVDDLLAERPREALWPQMQGRTVEQKQMEHVCRLLSYAVKRVVEADKDAIVPFASIAGKLSLLDRVHEELQALFPSLDIGQIETEITNELKKAVKGYRRSNSIEQWLCDVCFDYHCTLYQSRPIIWHIASAQGTAPSAFGALVSYHRFDRHQLARLRGHYLREAIESFRREAALAEKAGQTEQRLEWQRRLEEAQDLDRRLQWIQEGHHEGPAGGKDDYRILTPWKSAKERPKGWDPDIDDGVKVNIEPLQKAGVLRIAKVV